MQELSNGLFVNFTSFYGNLNEIGRLVFLITVLLFLILMVLVVIMLLQKTISDRQLDLIYEDEVDYDKPKSEISIEEIDIENDKTKNLKDIVDELKKYEKPDKTDLYEDEQEKTAIISYQELMKAADSMKVEEPKIQKIEPEKPEKKEIFSSVFTPNQKQVYKEKEYNENDLFLRNLKEFRNNL